MKNKWQKSIVVYFGGLLTGLALILYPAMGPIFTDPAQFAFTNTQFGRIFIPQIVFAILAALSAPFFVTRFGTKKALLIGLFSLTITTATLLLSHFFIHEKAVALLIVFTGTSFLGLGFGLVITVLNPLAFKLFPKNELASVTGLHFALGLGTAGAPLLIGILQHSGNWWYLPLYTSLTLLSLVIFVFTQSFKELDEISDPKTQKFPLRLWGFVALIVFYGICEGAMGSYGSVFLKSQGLSIKYASFGLAMFWSGLAFGRISYSLLSIRFKVSWIYISAPILLALLLFIIPMSHNVIYNIVAMALAGIFMSSIFPNTVSWATKEFLGNSMVVSAFMVAALQFGTGISTNFLGYLSINYSLGLLLRYIGGIAFLVFILIMIMRKYANLDNPEVKLKRFKK